MPVKLHHAGVADAGLVAQGRRHLREQGFGNLHLRTPARAFVSRNGAEPAIVGLVAQWTLAGIQRPLCSGEIHFSPNSEAGMGSARVPRASSGVAPELSSPISLGFSGGEKFAGQGFRRDAENHTPEAWAPRNTSCRPFSISDFGFNEFPNASFN